MNGTIEKFYQGCGWIIGENGERFFLHYNNILGKEKHYKKGRKVTFDPLDEGKTHRSAVNVVVETFPVPPPHPRTGYGDWVGTKEKGRIRCTDCGCTTELGVTPFCPHCGAVMRPDMPPNDEERLRETPEWWWHETEYGYRCGYCKLIYAYPAKHCPRCGKRMNKPENLPKPF